MDANRCLTMIEKPTFCTSTSAPYAEQESEELGDEVVARLNPGTGAVENLEVLFFSTRLLRGDLSELLIRAAHYGRPAARRQNSRFLRRTR
jgi:hypothetical protein